jgi:hypothetical protein
MSMLSKCIPDFEIKEGDYDNLLIFDKYETVDMIRIMRYKVLLRNSSKKNIILIYIVFLNCLVSCCAN